MNEYTEEQKQEIDSVIKEGRSGLRLKTDFGTIILKKRVEMGLTRKLFSERLNIPERNLFAIENGKSDYSFHHLRTYLKALDMKLSEVFL